MGQVKDFVARNFDRYQKGELTVTRFIVDAIQERLAKLDRAKRSGRRQRHGAADGVIHRGEGGPSRPVSSDADTNLSGGTGRTAGNGQEG